MSQDPSPPDQYASGEWFILESSSDQKRSNERYYLYDCVEHKDNNASFTFEGIELMMQEVLEAKRGMMSTHSTLFVKSNPITRLVHRSKIGWRAPIEFTLRYSETQPSLYTSGHSLTPTFLLKKLIF